MPSLLSAGSLIGWKWGSLEVLLQDVVNVPQLDKHEPGWHKISQLPNSLYFYSCSSLLKYRWYSWWDRFERTRQCKVWKASNLPTVCVDFGFLRRHRWRDGFNLIVTTFQTAMQLSTNGLCFQIRNINLCSFEVISVYREQWTSKKLTQYEIIPRLIYLSAGIANENRIMAVMIPVNIFCIGKF